MVTVSHNETEITTQNVTTSQGFRIAISSAAALTVNAVTKASSCTATTAYIYTSGGSQLSNASFSGDTATFSQELSAGEHFYIEADKGGSAYDRTQYGSPPGPYPIAGSNPEILTWESGSSGASDVENEAWNLLNFDVTVPTDYTSEPTALALTISEQDPTIVISDTETTSALAITLTLNTGTLDIESFLPSFESTGTVGTQTVNKEYYSTANLISKRKKIKDYRKGFDNYKYQSVWSP